MIQVSQTLAVPLGATSMVVPGAFVLPYQVEVGLSWGGGSFVTAKTATSYTVVFGFAAPASSTMDVTVTMPSAAAVAGTGATTAGTLINRVRPKIQDLVFLNDLPQPDTDGKFRVQVLYSWLDDAIQVMTQLTGWTLRDWWCMPQVALQPWYPVSVLFHSMDRAFANQWELELSQQVDEGDTIWPQSQAPMSTQPLIGYSRGLAGALSIGVWPTPPTTDPTTTLNGAITATTPDPIVVVSTTGFLSYGYVQIDNEIIQYQQRTATGLGVLSRGIGGTTAAAHLSGALVQHLGLWISGLRVPTRIVNSASIVEVPLAWMSHLESYVLAQVRITQPGRFQEGQALLKNFEAACRGVNADPNWKDNRAQIRAFGENVLGPYVWGGAAIRN